MTTSVRTRLIDDPHDLLAHLAEPDSVAWVNRGQGLVGWGLAGRWEATAGDGDPFAAAQSWFADWCARADVDDPVAVPGSGPVAFASFAFDPAASRSVVIVPRVVVGRRDGRAWMTVVDDGGPAPQALPRPAPRALPVPGRIRYAGSALDEVEWLDAVAAAVASITAGGLSKVVLARDVAVWSDAALDARVLARRLAERFEDCFTFICDGLVGATPELLARRSGRAVESLVFAGSAARGATAAHDTRLGETLLGSHKDLWEHELAVESVRPVLAQRSVEMHVDGPQLVRLANVQHLMTRVHGQLADAAAAVEPVLSLVAALHPTAAVCGTPADVALAHIRKLESFDRGRYAGPVGWTDARGDGEFGIALRCAEVSGTRARLFAGAGVVAESLPEAELEETRLKLRAMQSALEQDGDTGTTPALASRVDV